MAWGWLPLRQKFGTGYVPDAEDTQDRLYRDTLHQGRTVSRSHALPVSRLTVKNQGSTSSCVGQAVANGIRLAFSLGGDCPDLSALFPYYHARRELAPTLRVSDRGSHIRLAMKSVQKFGICEERYWPFATRSVNTQPSWSAQRYAWMQKGLRGYYRIKQGDVASVLDALTQNKPVVAGWSLDASFYDYRPGTVYDITGPSIGRHAMLVYGYESSGFEWKFKVLNSWGTGWGDGGRCVISERFMSRGIDLWALDVYT